MECGDPIWQVPSSHGASETFKEENWMAFYLTAVEGKDIAFVADHLGISKNQVSLARGRIPKRLRQKFGDDMDGLFPTLDQDGAPD